MCVLLAAGHAALTAPTTCPSCRPITGTSCRVNITPRFHIAAAAALRTSEAGLHTDELAKPPDQQRVTG